MADELAMDGIISRGTYIDIGYTLELAMRLDEPRPIATEDLIYASAW